MSEQSFSFELKGQAYEAVAEAASDQNLSLADALTLLVLNGIRNIRFERLYSNPKMTSLNQYLDRVDSLEEKVDSILANKLIHHDENL